VFRQREAECGNTALKAVCWYHSVRISARRLAELAGASESGIDHAPLVRAARATGAGVFVRSGGTLAELSWFIRQGYPILVGWWSLEPGARHFDPAWTRAQRAENDRGHYSVVTGVTDRYVWLMDPLVGHRKLGHRAFLEAWYDTDGPRYRRVDRWYMVIHYDPRRFRSQVPGGRDHGWVVTGAPAPARDPR
jgi:ABC-type bacteriocin/lantibiotic exporter with double-glycine peptidase domain